MKDLGKVKNCVGIEFSCNSRHQVFLKQRKYTESVLEQFGMKECKPACTSIEANCKLSKPEHVSEQGRLNKFERPGLKNFGALAPKGAIFSQSVQGITSQPGSPQRQTRIKTILIFLCKIEEKKAFQYF